MTLNEFAKAIVKQASITSKVLKASALLGTAAIGAGTGAGLAYSIGKKKAAEKEKRLAKQFYWLGRNTDPGNRSNPSKRRT